MKTDAKKVEQLPTIRITPELMALIRAEAAAAFERIPDIVRARLEASYAADGAPPPIKTAAMELREQKERLVVEKMERDAARDRRELISVEEAVAVVEVEYGRTRQELLSLASSAQLDIGLDDEQTRKLAKLVEDRMTNLTGASREALDDLTNN